MGRETVAVCAIVLNEAAQISGWLANVLPWADQVVVVDGGSSDETPELVRQASATAPQLRLLSRPFDDFASQRNFAAQHATTDWVLALDADERVTQRFRDELGWRLRRTSVAAFRVPIRSTIFGRRFRFSGTQDDLPIRLFRRGQAWWSGEVHEVPSVRGRIGRWQAFLRHTTLPDQASFDQKVARYTRLEAVRRCRLGVKPLSHRRWLAPPREWLRRYFWKLGVLDGQAGWRFAVGSARSEWLVEQQHREFWQKIT